MNVDANVRKILVALFKKWQLIVIIAVIGGMLGYFYTAKFTTLTYTSSVEFLAEADDPTDEIVSTGSSSSNEYARTSNTSKMNYAIKMLPTYIEIFNTNKFDNRVAFKQANQRKLYTVNDKKCAHNRINRRHGNVPNFRQHNGQGFVIRNSTSA